MALTPADVHNVAFSRARVGKRGYSEQEVDLFIDLVEQELTRHIEEDAELRQSQRRASQSGWGAQEAGSRACRARSRPAGARSRSAQAGSRTAQAPSPAARQEAKLAQRETPLPQQVAQLRHREAQLAQREASARQPGSRSSVASGKSELRQRQAELAQQEAELRASGFEAGSSNRQEAELPAGSELRSRSPPAVELPRRRAAVATGQVRGLPQLRGGAGAGRGQRGVAPRGDATVAAVHGRHDMERMAIRAVTDVLGNTVTETVHERTRRSAVEQRWPGRGLRAVRPSSSS